MSDVVVYIWGPVSGSWGHASLEVDDVYISWWPKDSKSKHSLKKKKLDGHTKDQLPKNYIEDKEIFMGRNASLLYCIPPNKVNSSKVKEWWRQKEKDGYHFFFNNCCDIVVKALRAGGASIPFKLIRGPHDTAIECAVLTEQLNIPLILRAAAWLA